MAEEAMAPKCECNNLAPRVCKGEMAVSGPVLTYMKGERPPAPDDGKSVCCRATIWMRRTSGDQGVKRRPVAAL